jgi:hypothetical protein
MAENFGSFFSDVGGGEGERCNYTTRLDTKPYPKQREK